LALGPLAGLRIVELASECAAYAGKLLGDFGAEVLLVEPPGGHATRRYGPLANELDDAHPDRSLWFWHYNTSKLGIELDLDSPEQAAQFRQLVAHSDVVVEAEPVGRLRALGLDYTDLCGEDSPVVWVCVTPFGRDDPRSAEPYSDLTVVCGGGIAWNCGYDDPTLPPMSSLGNQGYQTASIWAALGALVAIRGRGADGCGQFVDVSMHAAANVTTEQATHWWTVAGRVMQRQTGRHASHIPTEPVICTAGDGHEVHTGLPPRTKDELVRLVQWIDDLGLRDEFPMVTLLDLAIEQGGLDMLKLLEDPFTQEAFRTTREAMVFIASRFTAREFFVEGQRRGFAVGVVLSPDEVMHDPQLTARGYPREVYQPQLGRSVTHAGLPIMFTGTPGAIRCAPGPGEHQHLVQQALHQPTEPAHGGMTLMEDHA
jgi:crotonobetainyl-CoA:carnitine CoA-transferase CaiB-like acyl-CoA transferase